MTRAWRDACLPICLLSLSHVHTRTQAHRRRHRHIEVASRTLVCRTSPSAHTRTVGCKGVGAHCKWAVAVVGMRHVGMDWLAKVSSQADTARVPGARVQRILPTAFIRQPAACAPGASGAQTAERPHHGPEVRGPTCGHPARRRLHSPLQPAILRHSPRAERGRVSRDGSPPRSVQAAPALGPRGSAEARGELTLVPLPPAIPRLVPSRAITQGRSSYAPRLRRGGNFAPRKTVCRTHPPRTRGAPPVAPLLGSGSAPRRLPGPLQRCGA